MAILQVQGIQKDFSGLKVLTGVDFEVGARERFAVIGPNGAGKTTLFNIISGKFRPSAGRVVFDGRDISSLPPYTRARLGMARSFQITNIFQRLSALDNILAGVRSRAGLRHHLLRRPHHDRDLMERSEEILARVGLAEQRHTPAQELAYGQQRALKWGLPCRWSPSWCSWTNPPRA